MTYTLNLVDGNGLRITAVEHASTDEAARQLARDFAHAFGLWIYSVTRENGSHLTF
jgi:hypothetical protein